MESISIIAISLFLISSFVFYRLTLNYCENEYAHKKWAVWQERMYHWQGVFFLSSGFTILALFALKWSNLVTF